MTAAHWMLLLVLGLLALSLICARAASRMGPKGRPGEAKTAKSVQDLMPLADIRGCWAFMKDGSYRAYMRWPGRNQSLDTDAERYAKALKDAAVLGSIETRFAILKYPESINSSRQLVLVDAAIAREEKAFFAAPDGPEREVHRRKLAILRDNMREAALKETLGSDRLSWPPCLVFCFPAGKDMKIAKESLDNIIRLAGETMENAPRYMDEREIRHLYQLYFTPHTVSDVAATKGSAALPDYGLFA